MPEHRSQKPEVWPRSMFDLGVEVRFPEMDEAIVAFVREQQCIQGLEP